MFIENAAEAIRSKAIFEAEAEAIRSKAISDIAAEAIRSKAISDIEVEAITPRPKKSAPVSSKFLSVKKEVSRLSIINRVCYIFSSTRIVASP